MTREPYRRSAQDINARSRGGYDPMRSASREAGKGLIQSWPVAVATAFVLVLLFATCQSQSPDNPRETPSPTTTSAP